MQRTKRASASNTRRYSPKQGALEERPLFPGFDLRTIREPTGEPRGAQRDSPNRRADKVWTNDAEGMPLGTSIRGGSCA